MQCYNDIIKLVSSLVKIQNPIYNKLINIGDIQQFGNNPGYTCEIIRSLMQSTWALTRDQKHYTSTVKYLKYFHINDQ